MALQPPIKIKRPHSIGFLQRGSGPWLPAAIIDFKQTCLMWDVVHTCKKNRTLVRFYRIKETVLFPAKPFGSISRVFSQDERIIDHTIDLNCTTCNHVSFSQQFISGICENHMFLQNPVSSQYLHSCISSTFAHFSLQFVLKSLLVHFPYVISSSGLVPFEVLHLQLSLCERQKVDLR